MSATSQKDRYDAVIVGGGHNGLVAGYYLARAGLRTLILERREFVGGACVTEEFAPGFRASTGAYVISMLREHVWRDMRLTERGIDIDTAGPSLYGFPDGERLLLGEDIAASQEEIRRHSAADARALPEFEADLGRLAEVIGPMMDMTPPDPAHVAPGDLPSLLKLAATGRKHRAVINDALFLFGTSCTQYLGERFSSDVVMAALGWHAINDSIAGPSTPGTAYVLLHDHAAEQAGGGLRTWGFVRGGIGRVTANMQDAPIDDAVHVEAIPVVAEAIADVPPVADDRAVVDDSGGLVRVEAVEIDAGAGVALDDAARIIGDAHGETGDVVHSRAGDAVTCAINSAGGVVGDLDAAVVLSVDAVTAGAGAGGGFYQARIIDHAVNPRAHGISLARLHDAGGVVVDGVVSGEDGREIHCLRSTCGGIE